jgi:hypothetical protein
MRRVLASERGGELYAKRQGMIEPVFADTKFNRRCDRFQRRGRAAVRSEWRLIAATHTLLNRERFRGSAPPHADHVDRRARRLSGSSSPRLISPPILRRHTTVSGRGSRRRRRVRRR